MTESLRNTWAIGKRELKSYFESPVAYVFLVVFLLLVGVFTFFVSHYYEQGQADLGQPFFFWHPWVYLLLVPAAAMRLWAEERRAHTIELLLTMPITVGQAIAGKFLAAWSFLGIALLLTCPIVFTTAYLGAPDMGVVLCGYIGSFLVAGTYLAVGMLTSSLTRNQVISFVISVIVCLLLALAGWPVVTRMFASWAPAWFVNGVAAFGVIPHYESIMRGVLDIRDLTYYASVIVFMLFATSLVLENKK